MQAVSTSVLRLPLARCNPENPPLLIRASTGRLPSGQTDGTYPNGGVAAGQNLSLQIAVAPLDTPDLLVPLGARIEGGRLVVEVEHRDFEGILGANVRECGVVAAELPPLASGRYEVTLRVRRVGFTELQRPDVAVEREVSEMQFHFQVT
jgi:hypothetical protein